MTIGAYAFGDCPLPTITVHAGTTLQSNATKSGSTTKVTINKGFKLVLDEGSSNVYTPFGPNLEEFTILGSSDPTSKNVAFELTARGNFIAGPQSNPLKRFNFYVRPSHTAINDNSLFSFVNTQTVDLKLNAEWMKAEDDPKYPSNGYGKAEKRKPTISGTTYSWFGKKWQSITFVDYKGVAIPTEKLADYGLTQNPWGIPASALAPDPAPAQ